MVTFQTGNPTPGWYVSDLPPIRRLMPGDKVRSGPGIKERRLAGPFATRAQARSCVDALLREDHTLRPPLYVWCESTRTGVESKMVITREYDMGVLRFEIDKVFDDEGGHLVESNKWVVNVSSGVSWLSDGPLVDMQKQDMVFGSAEEALKAADDWAVSRGLQPKEPVA